MPYQFATATEIVFGAGSSQSLPDRVRREGAIAVSSSPALPRPAARRFSSGIRAAGVAVIVWPLAHQPTLDDARAATELAREHHVDVVAAIGGGSAIDSAKAVAALATNGGDPLDYLEVIGRGSPSFGSRSRSSRCRRPPEPARRSRGMRCSHHQATA